MEKQRHFLKKCENIHIFFLDPLRRVFVKNSPVYLLLFYTSFLLISYEVLFTRIFALNQWQTYTGIIISIALSGFGISGSLITLFNKKIIRAREKVTGICLVCCLFCFIAGLLFYSLIPFNPYEVLWSPRQLLYFFLQFFILLIPFTAGPALIGIQFLGGEKVPSLYFATLTGSAAGGLCSYLLLYLFPPLLLLEILVLLFAALTAFYVIRDAWASSEPANDRVRRKTLFVFLLSIFFLLLFITTHLQINRSGVSEYKDMYTVLHLPRAKVLVKKHTPRGIMFVIEADGLRNVYGLSLNYTGSILEQKAVFIDGDFITAIYPGAQAEKTDFFLYTSSALPYCLVSSRESENQTAALVVSAGGGEAIYRGLAYSIDAIDALEQNRDLVKLMKQDFASFSGNIYNRKEVRLFNRNIRDFSPSGDRLYDIIDVTFPSTSTGSIYSTSSTGENYLFTREGLKSLFVRLKPRGILSFTGKLMQPPRDSIKLFAALLKILEESNFPEQHICFIRSINTFTIAVSKLPFDPVKVQNFCNQRSFDIVYLFPPESSGVNKHFIFSRPLYFEPVRQLLDTKRSAAFIKDYLFDIRPASDNRPYHYNFFKLTSFFSLDRQKLSRIPFTRWGIGIYILLLFPVILITALGTGLPLILKKTGSQQVGKKELFSVCVYFFLIGMGYFCIEIPLIQKCTLFLSIPVFSFSIILTSLLAASGAGSYFSGKMAPRLIRFSYFIITFYFGAFILFIDPFLTVCSGLPLIIKVIITGFLAAVPGFFMGIPFPAVMGKLRQDSILRSWAWGINGFASVLAALGAAFFSIILGFPTVLAAGALFYSAAGWIYFRIDGSHIFA